MKKKIDLFWYWFIFVVAFVLCFFAINDKKVNAYHLNEEGNLVSDNLFDFENMSICGYSWRTTCDINNNELSISSTSTADDMYPVYLIFTKNLKSYLLPNTIYTVSFEYVGDFKQLSIFNSNDTLIKHGVIGSNKVTFDTGDNSNIYFGVYIDEGLGNSTTISNIQLELGANATSYEPFGTWYSESNLNTEKEISYEDGYNAGIVANNTAPSFYFDDITSLMQFRVLGNTSYVYVDNMSNVTGYNSIINFSELLGVQYGSAYFSQYYWTTLSLLNTINVSDTLVFNFSDIGNYPDFSTKTAITFSSSSSCYDIGNGGTICPNYATFTYDELSQNNFTLKLEDFAELENITEIDTISVQLYYNGTRSFGLLTLEDETLTGDITSDYEIGYRVGFITGEESGVVKGETIGYDKGYNEGYRKASQVVKDPGNNTLVGMVSVLMGMPVNMLVSIYDFDFLGINLAEFFFSLITLLVSIWLIKKLL